MNLRWLAGGWLAVGPDPSPQLNSVSQSGFLKIAYTESRKLIISTLACSALALVFPQHS